MACSQPLSSHPPLMNKKRRDARLCPTLLSVCGGMSPSTRVGARIPSRCGHSILAQPCKPWMAVPPVGFEATKSRSSLPMTAPQKCRHWRAHFLKPTWPLIIGKQKRNFCDAAASWHLFQAPLSSNPAQTGEKPTCSGIVFQMGFRFSFERSVV